MFNPATVYQTKKRTVKIQFIQMFITMVTYELQQKKHKMSANLFSCCRPYEQIFRWL